MVSNILANINITSPASSSGSWANITGMSVSGITVQGTNSVLLLMFNMNPEPKTDATAEYRFYVNGSEVGSPVLTAFADSSSNDETNSVTMVWAIDGLSGSSNSFSIQWKTVQGSPTADETRNRTFQILEIVGGDAEIIVDMSSSSGESDPGTWADLFTSVATAIAGTGSILLMIGNVPYNMEADEMTDFQFAVDSTEEGAVTSVYTDENLGGNGWSGVHVLDGLSTGDHTFHIEWQASTGNGQTDSTRLRTFQVVEITASATLQIELVSAVSGSSTSGYKDVEGLSDSYTVAGTSAIALIFANVMLEPRADDNCNFMVGIDSSEEGAELISFTDSTATSNRILLARAKTGLSNASHTFSARWQQIQASILDEGRARSLFVIEFTQVAYKLEGFTYDKDGEDLGSCDCYLYKDNLDNTISFVAHVVSNAVTGAYIFTGISDNDPQYLVAFIKDDSPHVFDVTDHVLQPVAE